MKYLSVCSGIEAATVAWHPLGWEAAAFSEIESFPRAVLAHHYPDVPCHGDFTTIKEKEYGTIDLLVGGTPCQSFSMAGLRKGFSDDRGNLTLEFIRLVKRKKPRWVVWENVPGVLSIDEGRAFGSFLGGLADCGYGFAYRVLDAQYFGVPQRRRRVFVIGYLGDWRPAAAVLFERESLQGDITPSRKARERIADTLTVGANQCSGFPGDFVEQAAVAGTLKGGSGARGWPDPSDGNGGGLVCGTVSSKWAKGTGGPAGDECQNLVTANCIAFSGKDHGNDAAENIAPTLRAMNHAGSRQNGGGQLAVAIPLQEIGKRTGISTNDKSIGVGIGNEGDVMFTLQANAQHGVAYDTRSGMAPHGSMQGDTICPTLRAKEHEPPMVLHDVAGFKPGNGSKARGIGYEEEIAPTLEAGGGGNSQSAVLQKMAVRRLTPRECERLQGFPDDYTLITYRKKEAADGSRYKALGNSMAVPVMAWLGKRIDMVEKLKKEISI